MTVNPSKSEIHRIIRIFATVGTGPLSKKTMGGGLPKIEAIKAMPEHVMRTPSNLIRTFLGTSSLGLFFTVGCIHPNVPSVRYGDALYPQNAPVGSGDIVGDLIQHSVIDPTINPAVGHTNDPAMVGQEAFCGGEGLLADELGSHRQPDTPEAPWPRFHPLPTRPVLGGTPIGK